MFEPKILVEVIGENGIKSRKTHRINGNKVIIEKPEKGRGKVGWAPKFDKDCILHRDFRPFPWVFKRHSSKLIVMEGAKECISFLAKDKRAKIPKLDKATITELMKASVLKAAGQVKQKIEIPVFFWLFMFMLIGLGALNLMAELGLIR